MTRSSQAVREMELLFDGVFSGSPEIEPIIYPLSVIHYTEGRDGIGKYEIVPVKKPE